jgi:hypothetical protein
MLITFGGGDFRWKIGAKRLVNQARQHSIDAIGILSSVSQLKEIGASERDWSFIQQNPRGHGYWLWKPLLINWAMAQFPNQSILFLDAGCELNFNPQSLKTYNNWSEKVESGENIFWEVEGDWSEGQYSKVELTNYFNLDEQQLNSRQIQSGTQWWSNNELSRDIAAEWLKTSRMENYYLLDDSITSRQREDFVAHRHDQSILSCLLKSQSISSEINQTHFAPNWQQDGYVYPFWTMRNRGILSRRNPNLFNKWEDSLRKLF